MFHLGVIGHCGRLNNVVGLLQHYEIMLTIGKELSSIQVNQLKIILTEFFRCTIDWIFEGDLSIDSCRGEIEIIRTRNLGQMVMYIRSQLILSTIMKNNFDELMNNKKRFLTIAIVLFVFVCLAYIHFFDGKRWFTVVYILFLSFFLVANDQLNTK